MAVDKYKVPASMLAPAVDPEQLGFKDTSELTPLSETIGQERAVGALEFGLQMTSPGFNIFVSGPVGTGKGTLVRQMVKRLAQAAAAPSDWCYVNNFQDHTRPSWLSFPAGRGCSFKREMSAFIDSLRQDIVSAFESKKYLDAKAKLHEEVESKKKVLFQDLKQRSQECGFGFDESPSGFGLVPLKAGRPITPEEMEGMSEEEQRAVTERRKTLEEEIREFYVRVHGLEKETEHQLHHLDRQVVANVMQRRYEALRQSYTDLPRVAAYLERVQHDIIHRYKDFLPREGPVIALPGIEFKRPDLSRYEINLIVEHEPGAGAPVIDEAHPTYTNLIGKIERRAHLGVMYTDFTEIRAGAVLLANGGFLVLNALDLLRQPFSWEALKRVIKTGVVTLEDPAEFYGFSTAGLKPEPIPVTIKVILVGPPALLHALQAYEEDFSRMFKVKADFDVEVNRDARHEQQYAQFVARVCRDENIPHFCSDAVAEVLRQAHRLADRHDRLSLRFSLVSDLIREAGYWARKNGHSFVSRSDVECAIDQKRYRSNLPEQRIQDEIREGTLMVSLDGEVVGQVNGLSVYQLGEYTFGRPIRITARAFIGTKGVIDIQREAEMAGPIHSKGVMILGGFLAGKFAGTYPLALSATLTFEQTYSEVEGDSAAVAELVAILSSLADVPVRQWLAVTGSINQLGEIQPIGGINEKIEGFFEACRKRGLTGKEGAIIPARNVKHLALSRTVVDAVASRQFSVFAVGTIDEAIEILTGLPAGERNMDGVYQPGTLYAQAAQRLQDMALAAAEWGNVEGQSHRRIITEG